MASTVRVKQTCSLKHQANLGEEIAEVTLETGEELTLLQEWEISYLVKNGDGKLFNIPKELVEPVPPA